MFGKNRNRNKNAYPKSDDLSSFISHRKDEWVENNCEMLKVNTWSQIYSYLKDDTKSLGAKLELIKNISINIITYFNRKPMPDIFWKDTTLDRKIRAYCWEKFQEYSSGSGIDNPDLS